MPTYIYKCQNQHESTIVHSFAECDIDHHCPICEGIMHRVPQAVRHGEPAGKLLLDRLNESFNDWKARNDKWKRRKQLGKLIS